jgi:bifunctional DNA-binding transcriptional regulator/antitoxin component of YhaV-PrlF toxin-antitoxin module
MDAKGRLVIPGDTRARHRLGGGSKLVLLDTDSGIVLLTREQLRQRVRADFQGRPLVDELLADRRTAALGEDAR